MALKLAFLNPGSKRVNSQVFGGLQELTIEDFSTLGQNLEQLQQVTKAMNAITDAARKLETLSILEIRDPDIVHDPIFLSMSDIMPYRGLAHIHDLTLRKVDLTKTQLAEFCKIRSKALVKVCFHNVRSKDGTWDAILDDLRSLKWPRLRQFRLDCCFDPVITPDAYDLLVDIRVEDFLLHRTDKIPKINLAEEEASSDELN